MYFNQSNIIILFAILLFSTYLILPQPIILIEKKYNLSSNKPNVCYNCI
jgi:hypothetical protein